MSEIVLFAQAQGAPIITEVKVALGASLAQLRKALADAGLPLTSECLVFLDDEEDHLEGSDASSLPGIKSGGRVHVVRCRRIKTTVHYLDKTIEREFAPGARVRAVKAWAVREFRLTEKDAAEHVLQICNTTKRPAGDVPVHELVSDKHCALCFDLVPEKRVEG